jgi:hypothetical protein
MGDGWVCEEIADSTHTCFALQMMSPELTGFPRVRSSLHTSLPVFDRGRWGSVGRATEHSVAGQDTRGSGVDVHAISCVSVES